MVTVQLLTLLTYAPQAMSTVRGLGSDSFYPFLSLGRGSFMLAIKKIKIAVQASEMWTCYYETKHKLYKK